MLDVIMCVLWLLWEVGRLVGCTADWTFGGLFVGCVVIGGGESN